jgi:hypothetical protein
MDPEPWPFDMDAVVSEVEKRLAAYADLIEVAVLGSAVNGIGEARHADFGITGANGDLMRPENYPPTPIVTGMAALCMRALCCETMRDDYYNRAIATTTPSAQRPTAAHLLVNRNEQPRLHAGFTAGVDPAPAGC